jgi:hypothetical protein
MSRRRRSGIADTAEEAAKMSLTDFESEIARCKWGFENGGTSQGRKAFFQRLVWLENMREELFGVPAPSRKFGSR